MRVRTLRLLGMMLYVAYLVHVGLLMVVLPWSASWSPLLARLPLGLAVLLDHPAARGAISGFGALHLLLVAAELALSPHRRPR